MYREAQLNWPQIVRLAVYSRAGKIGLAVLYRRKQWPIQGVGARKFRAIVNLAVQESKVAVPNTLQLYLHMTPHSDMIECGGL
jgi:hypothetical protein